MGKKIIRLVITTLIIYIVIMSVYLLFFYEPIEYDVGSLGSYHYNVMSRIDKEIENSFRFMLFLIAFLVSIIGLWVFDFFKPIEDIRATLISKEIFTSASFSMGRAVTSNIGYCMVFRLENGEEKIFHVRPHEYAVFLVGNKGILSYKENAFKGFYIEEIE